MERLPKFCTLKSIVIGSAFPLPSNPESNVTCEYELVIDLKARDSVTGRAEYHRLRHSLTVQGVAEATDKVYAHAGLMARLILGLMQTPESQERNSEGGQAEVKKRLYSDLDALQEAILAFSLANRFTTTQGGPDGTAD